MIADCRLPIVDCGACRACRWPLGALDSRLSTLRSPRRRRGISLLEILISIFVLAGGLLAVAALIPLGRLSLMETEKSDRTGACGRAAMREVRIRGMLDPAMWAPAPTVPNDPFIIDPLGRLASIGNTFGGAFDRISLFTSPTSGVPLTALQADAIFRWHDDLLFVRPEEVTSGTVPPSGTRPSWMDSDGNLIPDDEGSYSWFVTAAPTLQPGTFTVSVVVCQKRVLDAASESVATGHCDTATGYGGVGVLLTGTHEIKRNEWVLLYTSGATPQCTWYRVVHTGLDGNDTRLNLVGPDWHGDGTGADIATVIVIPGVTGVYTSTVQLN